MQTPARRTGYFLFVPLILYFAIFCLYTYPWIARFSTHYFCDQGDGFQNVWNLWWIDWSITVLKTHPWFTNYLHYPFGASLLPHTLNPFNGLIYIPAIRFLNPIQSHNLVVIFSFVAGGLTAFWLAYKFSRSYLGSLVGGGIFTFSAYHFAHAIGHLQLVSLEWLPAFALAWWLLLESPGLRKAILASLMLLFVILCDYYYFFYCVMFGLLALAYLVFQQKDWRLLFHRHCLQAMGLFLLISIGTSGVLAASLLCLAKHDPLLGSHRAEEWGLDLLAPFVYGEHWRFSALTRGIWHSWHQDRVEVTVQLGLVALAVAAWTAWNRKRIQVRELGFWFLVLASFWLLSLGPQLRILGHIYELKFMPYDLLARALPFFEISGSPNRMIVMVTLALSVIVATGFPLLIKRLNLPIWAIVLIVIVMAVEYWPASLPVSQMEVPEFVNVLRNQPDREAVIDLVHPGQVAMYFQTFHHRPIAYGYTSRVTQSIAIAEQQLTAAAQGGDYFKLCSEYGLGYLVAPANKDLLLPDNKQPDSLNLLYQGQGVQLFKLGKGPCTLKPED